MKLPVLSIAVCLVANISAAAQGASEYRVQAGDVIDVSVASIPDMRQRVSVQMDGSISLPIAGTIYIEGATVTEMRARVRSALASKIIRTRAADGRELSRMVEPEEVAVGVAEYKPIFISGDVARPGEQAFRPRMTVRHAIIAAGGSLNASRTSLNTGDVPGLRSEYVNAWLGVAGEEARIWRVRTELGEKIRMDVSSLPPSPVPEKVMQDILVLEKEMIERRNASNDREREFLRLAIREADQQIAVLTEQQKAEEEGVQADARDLQRALDMYGKGALPSPRVTDYRRAVLMSSTRKLQTGSQLIQVKRTRADFARSLEKLDEDRRTRLIAEQREAVLKSAVERAKLQAVEEKLRVAGLQPPRAVESGDRLEVAILRRSEQGRNRLIVDQDSELQPGDVVEISLGGSSMETVRLATPSDSSSISPQGRAQ